MRSIAAGRGLMVAIVAVVLSTSLLSSCDPGIEGEALVPFTPPGADYLVQLQRAEGGDIGIGVAVPSDGSYSLEFSLDSTVAVAALVDPVRDESQPYDDPYGRYLIVDGRRRLPYGVVWFRTQSGALQLDLGAVAAAVLDPTNIDRGGTRGFVSVCSQTGFGSISTSSADVEMIMDEGCAVWLGDLTSVPPDTIITIDMGRQWFTLLPLLMLAVSAAAIVWTLVARGLGRQIGAARWLLVACLVGLAVQVVFGYWIEHSRSYSSVAGQFLTTNWILWRFALAMFGFGVVALLVPRVRQRRAT